MAARWNRRMKGKLQFSGIVFALWLFPGYGVFAEGSVFAVDQVGYLPEAPKMIYTTANVDSFFIVDNENNQVVIRGELSAYESIDPAVGETVSLGEFSALNTPGAYFAVSSGNDTSAIFVISDSVYAQVYRQSLKGFYFQRCGTGLTTDYAGEYQHPVCHQMDAVIHVSTDTSGFMETKGGWHDAGDFGKYIVNAGVTVGSLLMGYEYFPERFSRDDIGIPESGNGIPDLLDEVRYELEWVLKMQNTDGGVFHKLTSKNFAGFVMPQNHSDTRYIYQISSTATADFAAMLARASRIYDPYDATFAQTMLTASENAWEYLAAHPDIVPSGGFQNPADTYTGEYGDNYDRDERLWAAAELYAATGETVYRNYYESHYQSVGLFGQSMSWQWVADLAHLTYLFDVNNARDANILQSLQTSLQSRSQDLLNLRNQSSFHVAIEPGEYVWGSNSVVLNRAMILIFGFKVTSDSSLYHAAMDQLHYILGDNIHDMTFVTGVGNRSPLHIHHRQSAADGIASPVPGLMSGGPNEYLSDPVLQSHFTGDTPAAKCYIDDVNSYASNEIAINWNAPLVFVAGYFSPEDTTAVRISSETKSIPAGFRLYPNYPNPFNDSTIIRFSLFQAQPITLTVYNLLGMQVYTKNLGFLSAGEYQIPLSGHDIFQGKSSGVYILKLYNKHLTQTQKLVLLK